MVCQRGYLFKQSGIFLLLCIVLFSCASTRDVTDNPVLRGNYEKGIVLINKTDVLLDKYNNLWDHRIDVENAKENGVSDEYRGFFKKGTKIQVIRIELYSHIENGNYIYPIALVLDGKWRGEEINLQYASISSDMPENDSFHINILDIDFDLFEIVTTGGESRNGQ